MDGEPICLQRDDATQSLLRLDRDGRRDKEGHFYNVTANSATALTVDTSTDNLTGIPANAQVLVIPALDAGDGIPSDRREYFLYADDLDGGYKTQIIPNFNFPGSDLPAVPVYFFSDNADGSNMAARSWE